MALVISIAGRKAICDITPTRILFPLSSRRVPGPKKNYKNYKMNDQCFDMRKCTNVFLAALPLGLNELTALSMDDVMTKTPADASA